VIRAMMDGHRPKVWLSDRSSAQQGHAGAQQTCLAPLARDVADAREASEDPLPMRLELWLRSAFDLAGGMTTFAASTLAAKRRTLEWRLAEILTAPTACDGARDLQRKFRGARDQLLTFVAFPGGLSRRASRGRFRARDRTLRAP
jgi:transposase